MIKFAKKVCTHTGKPYRLSYRLTFSRDTGAEELVVCGKEDFDGLIQSSLSSCDLNKIITRVRNGEVNLLNVHTAMFGDSTQYPTSLEEVLQFKIDADRMYGNLPDDIRKSISFDEFLKDAGSVDWLKKLGFEVKLPEEKHDES